MGRVPEKLTAIVEPIVQEMGYECVGIEYASHQKNGILRVFIDSANGVVLDDCANVSHQLSGALDVEDPISGNYQLEVSSPGLDRPLFKLEDFERFSGMRVDIRLVESIDNRRKITALLRGVSANNVVVEVDDKIMEIPLSTILKARLIPEYQMAKKGR